MANNKVLIVRIAGLGEYGVNECVRFSSRPLPAFSDYADIDNVIVDAGNQLSSEIALFGAMGSDPSTSVTLLNTPATARYLLGRGKLPYRNSAGQVITTNDYIKPFPNELGEFEIKVSDSTAFNSGDWVRIASTVFQIENVIDTETISVTRKWNCAALPIPMVAIGFRAEGIACYKVNSRDPLGGAEGLPITISTAEIDATSQADEAVIFRGIVTRVSVDTSAGATNRIKLDCSSIMGLVKSATFNPPRNGEVAARISDLAVYEFGNPIPLYGPNSQLVTSTVYSPNQFGKIYEMAAEGEGVALTRVPIWQIRLDSTGGPSAISNYKTYPTEPGRVYIETSNAIPYSFQTGNYDTTYFAYQLSFNSGYYTLNAETPLDAHYTVTRTYESGGYDGESTNDMIHVYNAAIELNPKYVGETCFVSNSPMNAIIDLLIGTYNADFGDIYGTPRFNIGCRSAQESAWLPFDIVANGNTGLSELIDLASLNALFNEYKEFPALTVWDENLNLGNGAYALQTVLPYDHSSVKTVGDVLELIMKRLGAFMVYDAGKFRFGKWGASLNTPVPVNDAALAEPKITMNFERGNCVQTVNVTFPMVTLEKVDKVKRPIINTELGQSGYGKTIELDTFIDCSVETTNFTLESLPHFINASNIILRYSQSAPLVEVTLRDEVLKLDVGQSISFSTSYLPNATGAMGVSNATGLVLKAARSWKTPTTSYSLLLPGYLTAVGRIAVIGASGQVNSVSGSRVYIEPNQFTMPPDYAAPYAPSSDAAAFAESLAREPAGLLGVQLLDKYGTVKVALDYIIAVDATANELTFASSDIPDAAQAKDIIVLADATISGLSLQSTWDSFQADGNGQVYYQDKYAYAWVR